jgi:hypothetical protein
MTKLEFTYTSEGYAVFNDKYIAHSVQNFEKREEKESGDTNSAKMEITTTTANNTDDNAVDEKCEDKNCLLKIPKKVKFLTKCTIVFNSEKKIHSFHNIISVKH